MSVEEALFAQFNKGKKMHKDAAAAVFTTSLRHSYDAMAPWMHASLPVLCRVCSGSVTTIEGYLACTSLPREVVDALVCDVLPSGACKTLQDMEQKLSARHASVADVLAVDARAWHSFRWHQTIPANASQWWRVIWLRINLAAALGHYMHALGIDSVVLREKLDAFIDAHRTCARHLDAHPDADGDTLIALYAGGCGASPYDEDRALMRVVERERLQTKPTPLQSIGVDGNIWVVEEMVAALEAGQHHVPADVWETARALPCMGEDAIAHPERYKLAYACLCIQHQCRAVGTEAHYWYFLAFIDLFAAKHAITDAWLLLPMHEATNLTHWETLYPFDTRAFLADDLPDAYHVLMHIPLRDQPPNNTFFLSKFLQKCLPYSGQRRSLIWITVAEIRKSHAFWTLFSRVMWCMLVNAYPGGGDGSYPFDLRYVLRCYELTHDRELMLSVLEGDRSKAMANGCLVVLCAFRLWMFHMVGDNEYYLEAAEACVADFRNIHASAREMAAIIRGGNIYPRDAFSMARADLSGKNNGTSVTVTVNRYKKYSCAGTLLKVFNAALEKDIYNVLRTLRVDCEALRSVRSEPDEVLKQFGPLQKTHFKDFFADGVASEARVTEALQWAQTYIEELETKPTEKSQKEHVLNALVNMPPADRLSNRGFSIMMLPEYGGINEVAVRVLCELVQVYARSRPMPKDYTTKVGVLHVEHVKIIAWYLNVVVMLDGIVLHPLDADTVRRTDRAMWTRRYAGHTHQPYAYRVYISLCCRKLKTLRGTDNYGHMHIAYNADMRTFVCSKNDKKTAPQKRREKRRRKKAREQAEDEDEDDDDDEDENDDDEDEDDDDDDDDAAALLNASDALERAAMDAAVVATTTTTTTVVNDNRYQRKDFHFIPCERQPVLEVDLRGYMLRFGKHYYVHCPECAALFKLERRLYHGASFCCVDCAADSNACRAVLSCAVCADDAPHDCILRVDREQLYFCKRHFRIARSRVDRLSKVDLFDYIRRIQHKQNQKRAGFKK